MPSRIRASIGPGLEISEKKATLFKVRGGGTLGGVLSGRKAIYGEAPNKGSIFFLFKNFCKDAKVFCIYLLFISILIHHSLKKISLLKKKGCSFLVPAVSECLLAYLLIHDWAAA